MGNKPRRAMSFQVEMQLEKRTKYLNLIQKAKRHQLPWQELERLLRNAGASFPEIQQIRAEYGRSTRA
jgi:hypothetical protein